MSSRTLKRALYAATVLALAVAASGCGKSIDSGQRGVYYNWSDGTDTENVLGEGFHWLAPWNKIITYDVRAKDRKEKLTVLTQDQLRIQAEISIRYRLSPKTLGKLHANVGPDFYQMLIQPVLRNAARDVVSGYNSIKAYQSRGEIQKEIRKAIVEPLQEYDYFELEAVMLRHMDFPKVVVDAIERKLAMKQEADREQFKLEKAKIQAKRKVVEAEATAKAQAILKAELNDTLLRWKGIQATMKLAESKNSKVIVVGSGKDGLPLILGGTQK